MTSLCSRSPSPKRIKLEVEPLLPTHEGVEIPQLEEPDQEDSEISCSICLHSIADRTVIPKCSHDFCFECLLVWTEQSRRCPLCSQAIGEYLIHSIRSRYDYRKHYLPPLRTSHAPSRPAQTNAVLQTARQRRRRKREWGSRTRESDEADKLERSIAKRRWIYQHDLYAKHVASNAYTKYRPYPTPAQFSASQDLISRTTTFLRRELQIWEGLDVEFLTTLIIALMKSIDIRSESAVKLISEFLDMDAPYAPGGRHVNAEHFAHEVYSYVRSPYKVLFVYDTVVQYDTPSHLPQPRDIERSHRWRELSPVRLANGPSADGRHSQKRSKSRSSERSTSWSPSGRKYSPTKNAGSSGHRRTSMSRRNSRSPGPSCDITKPWDKQRQKAESGPIGRQNYLGDASQTPLTSSSKERVKETPIISMERDVKGKRKAEEIGMTTSLTDGPDSAIVMSNSAQSPVVTEKDAELDEQTRNRKPIKIFRVPRNRTLLDSVKAHLAVSDESVEQKQKSILSQTADPGPSLLTRLSVPPYVSIGNSIKARNMSGDCQRNAGGHGKHETSQNEVLHAIHSGGSGQDLSQHDIDNSSSIGSQERQPSSSRSQDGTQSRLNYSPRTEKQKPPTSSKNSCIFVPSANIINQSPPISARPIILDFCQNSVEDNTMAMPSYRSHKEVDHDIPPNLFQSHQISHVQPPIDALGYSNFLNQSRPLAHSTSLNSVETRAKLLARLEFEKRQVRRPQTLDDGPSSSFNVSRKNHPFYRDAQEREPDVLDLASDPHVSKESRKKESKLRARAQLHVRLAAEKQLAG